MPQLVHLFMACRRIEAPEQAALSLVTQVLLPRAKGHPMHPTSVHQLKPQWGTTKLR